MSKATNNQHVFFVLLFCLCLPSVSIAEPKGSSQILAPDQIGQYLKIVLTNHPAMLAKHSHVDAVKSDAAALARAAHNPYVTLEYQEGKDSDDMEVALHQTLELGGKRKARTKLGERNSAVASNEFFVAEHRLAIDVLNALAERQIADEQQRLAQERVDIMSRFLATVERQYRAGDLGQSQVDLAFLGMAEANSLKVDSELHFREAERQLRTISQRQPLDWPKLPAKLPPLGAMDSPHTSQIAHVEAAALVKLAKSRQRAAEAGVAVAESRQVADLTLGLGFEREIDIDDETTSWSLFMTVPLHVRNRYQEEVLAAHARDNASRFELEAIRRRVALSADAAAENYRSAHHAWSQWHELTDGRLDAGVARLERLRKAGDVSISVYLLQVKQHLDTRAMGLRLLGHGWRGWISWLDATGSWKTWLGIAGQPKQITPALDSAFLTDGR